MATADCACAWDTPRASMQTIGGRPRVMQARCSDNERTSAVLRPAVTVPPSFGWIDTLLPVTSPPCSASCAVARENFPTVENELESS